jgi:NDP-sugar pyrophosphorylase family protein
MNTVGVILAAGRSTRMKFNKLTALVSGHSLVWYPVNHMARAGVPRLIVVVGHERLDVQKAIDHEVEWVVQEEQLGTGHAAAQAVPLINGADTVVVLFGDCPFLDSQTIEEALDTHRNTDADVTIATANIREPWSLGVVVRSAGAITEIISNRGHGDAHGVPSHEVFTGLSVWSATVYREYMERLPLRRHADGQSEYELPDAFAMLAAAGGSIQSIDVAERDALGPNFAVELRGAQSYMRDKNTASLIETGVSIPDLERTQIDYDVSVGQGTILRANTNLYGTTSIGANCQIGPDATLKDCIVGDSSTIGRGSWQDQVFPANSIASDRLAATHDYFGRPQYLIAEDPLQCCMVMPFKEPYLTLFQNIIRPTLQDHGLQCRAASDQVGTSVIINDVWEDINRAHLVLAEITEANTNVWYELGLAHALNKSTIMLSRTAEDEILDLPLSFNIRHQRVLQYDPLKGDLSSRLRDWLKAMKA